MKKTTTTTVASVAASAVVAVPVPFIYLNEENGEYEISQEAKELFSNQTEPFGIISIVGKYRTGKSFFLNRCLLSPPSNKKSSSQLKGFNVGNSVQACTKGLWIYTKPLKTKENMSVYVIDTEGISSLDANGTHDIKIFALALLMSSFFIYNSLNAIDDEALNQLSLVTNICKQIRLSSDKESTPEELGREVFPPLFWMVRDFSLQLKNENGQQMQPNEYLEFALQDSLKYEDKNQLRKCLKACFPRRSCATLIRPCNDEYELQMLSSSSKTELKPVFIQQLNWVREFILSKIESKNSQGKNSMSGKGYLLFAESIISAINAGVSPVIKDSWALIAELQCRDAVDYVYQNSYLPLLKETFTKTIYNPNEIQQLHTITKNKIMAIFRNENRTYQMQESTGTSMKKWESLLMEKMETDLQRLLEEYRKLNELQIFNQLNSFDDVFLNTNSIVDENIIQEQESRFFLLIDPIINKSQLGVSETLLTQFSKKCFKWLSHLSNLSVYFEQNYKLIEKDKIELQTEIENKRNDIEKMIQQLSDMQQKCSNEIAEKDSQIEIMKTELCELQEENTKWMTCFNNCDNITLKYEDQQILDNEQNQQVSEFNTNNSLDDLNKQHDALQEQLNESRTQFINEIKDIKIEFDKTMSDTKEKHNQYCLKLEEKWVIEKDNNIALQKTIESKIFDIHLLEEKLKTIEAKYAQFETNQKTQFDLLQKTFLTEINIQKNINTDLQQLRLDDQSKWLNKVKEAETACITATYEANNLKRKIEKLTDPQKFKRFKSENQSLQQKVTQLTTVKEHLETNLQMERDKNVAFIAKHDDLLLKFHNLQREKEKTILTLTMDYEKRLAGAPFHNAN